MVRLPSKYLLTSLPYETIMRVYPIRYYRMSRFREFLVRGALGPVVAVTALTAGSCEVPKGPIVLPSLGSPTTHLVAGENCPTGEACATFDVPSHTAFAVEANDDVTVSVNGQAVPMPQGNDRLAQQDVQAVVDNFSDRQVTVTVTGSQGTEVATIESIETSTTPPDFLHPTTDAILHATQYLNGVTLEPTASHQPARRNTIQGGQQKFAVVTIVNGLGGADPFMRVVLSGANGDIPPAATK